MEITGHIKMVSETQTFGSNGFRKRELVVTTEEQYPQHILVEFVQDKCDLLNPFSEGQEVKVSINLRGREWVNPQGETKYFNSIQGWRIAEINGAPSQSPSQEYIAKQEEAATKIPDNKEFEEESEDDLPF